MADEPTNVTDPEAPGAIVIPDTSATQEELNAKIDSELGLTPEAKPEPPKEDTPDEPTTPTEEPAPEEEAEPASSPDSPDTEEPVKPEPATPSDENLFIEVEDAEGVTHKISSIEDLPTDFVPKNNRQIMEIIKATDKLDREREANAEATEKAEQEAFVEETKQAQFTSWDNEIAELAKSKRVDVSNTERINDVFGYMNEVNTARREAGNPNLITSFEDALDKFEAKEAKDTAEQAKKNGNDVAKIKSGLIGRSSASSGGNNYVYRAGSARSIDDIAVSMS